MTAPLDPREAALRNCPFCGGTAAMTDTMPAGQFWCYCEECTAEGSSGDTAELATLAWNRRALEAAPVAGVVEDEALNAGIVGLNLMMIADAIEAERFDSIVPKGAAKILRDADQIVQRYAAFALAPSPSPASAAEVERKTWYAVFSSSGMHIGLWESEDTAKRVKSEHAGNYITVLHETPPSPVQPAPSGELVERFGMVDEASGYSQLYFGRRDDGDFVRYSDYLAALRSQPQEGAALTDDSNPNGLSADELNGTAIYDEGIVEELDDLASDLNYEANQESDQEKSDRARLISKAVMLLRVFHPTALVKP